MLTKSTYFKYDKILVKAAKIVTVTAFLKFWINAAKIHFQKSAIHLVIIGELLSLYKTYIEDNKTFYM